MPPRRGVGTPATPAAEAPSTAVLADSLRKPAQLTQLIRTALLNGNNVDDLESILSLGFLHAFLLLNHHHLITASKTGHRLPPAAATRWRRQPAQLAYCLFAVLSLPSVVA
nr:hypothetical protein Iba_chr04aCG17760 [Ipomoea batatas]